MAPAPAVDGPSPLPLVRARSIAAAAPTLAPVRYSLAEAIGCVSAEPLFAQQNIPHAATSAMDGWAVTASKQREWRLRSEGADRPEILLTPLQPGEAVEVVTGSPIPEGTSSVLRSEHGHTARGDTGTRALTADAATPDLEAGRNIRPEAVEARAGDLLCEAGKLLTPVRAATAAVAGYDELLVTPQPRTRLLLTGGEVTTAGLPPRGKVRDVFGLALPQMLTAMGAVVTDSHRIGDDVDVLAELMAETTADLIITTGGTAHSRADVLRPALRQLGAEILIGSVDMRPGHPAVLARTSTSYVLGLPGNPLAGFCALAALGSPLVRALGGIHPASGSYELRAGAALPGARRGVRVLPVQIRGDQVYGVEYSQAHMMRGLAFAEALAIVPHGGAKPGDSVECLPVPGASPQREHQLPRLFKR